MTPQAYQEADHAVAAGWLADATLTTALNVIYDWQGWKTTADELDAALTEVNIPPAKPVAGGSYRVSYPRPLEQLLSGDVRKRRVALDLHLRVQPSASSTAWTSALAAASDIKERIIAQNTDAAVPVATEPLVLTSAPRRWLGYRLLLSAWMGET